MTAEQLINEIKGMEPEELGKLLAYFPRAWPSERPAEPTSLSQCLDAVDTPEGRARVGAVLAARPFPHYEAGPGPGLLVKIDSDGTRTVGRVVGREFRAVRVEKRRSVAAVKSAVYAKGQVAVRFMSGASIRFPVAISPRLAAASKTDLRNVEVSPYGLHWPALDEDLSFAGLFCGTHWEGAAQVVKPGTVFVGSARERR